ncbi:MAG: RDD family protein [Desulfobacteraceae bacterium]|nr:RDD family protein [Desulfobacteraceae bacterium]
MNNEKTNTLTIITPEGIAFSLHLAGPVTRFLAWLIDFAVIMAIIYINRMIILILNIISPDIATALSILAYFCVSVGYGIIMEWYWHGQTLGKRTMRLRVMDGQGLHLQFSQIVIRNLLRFIDSLPGLYLVGGIACLFTTRAQRLGDMAANTIVVWTRGSAEPDLDQILSDKYNSFRDYPHIGARLRQRVSPAEADIALQAILRRDELDPIARIELFRDISSYFKTIVKFDQEATEGLSDEQYIRNVVDILYRT